ncbi:MAG: response regulator [Gammaproteobacteria bacterium]|jgi:DNA-binding response OmpR family regulator/signal transduction histidine kinase|nr:response regulator [Gammaproteobacteria bacterium]MBT3472272.1 response regulator [Gammaproteobacteria bacterium]MBT3966933.1 response regulator [Gammaproteobacteria bacterium]MBT4329061.1 response regulator [Gammaproteobacteria bacterium]MBT4811414.1 response regulator [Thiotrichales bacterium]
MPEYDDVILIVDDTPQQSLLLRRVLEDVGFNNLTVENNPLTALNKFRQSTFDLVLLDYDMPEMSGIELMEQMILHQKPEGDEDEVAYYVPIVILTADHDKATRLQALKAGARDFITKPFNREEVIARVNNLLEAQRAAYQLKQQAERLDTMYSELSVMHQEVLEQKATIELMNVKACDERDFVESILRSIQEGVVVIDPEGKVIRSNQKMVEMAGRGDSVGSMMGLTLSELFVPVEERISFSQAMLLSLQQHLQSILNEDENRFWSLLDSAPVSLVMVDETGIVNYLNGSMEAITGGEHSDWVGRQYVDLLAEMGEGSFSIKSLQEAFSSAHGVVLEQELQTQLPHSSSAEEALSASAARLEVKGEPALLVMLYDPLRQDCELLQLTPFGSLFQNMERNKKILSVERKLRREEGDVLPVQISGGELHTVDGESKGGVLVVYDLSDRKLLEQAAQEAAYRGGIAEISSNVAHNVGNSMTAVKFYLDELMLMKPVSQRLEEVLKNSTCVLNTPDSGGRAIEENMINLLVGARERFLEKTLDEAVHSAEQIIVFLAEQKKLMGGGERQYWVSRFNLQQELNEALLLIKEQVLWMSVQFELEVDPSLIEVSLPRHLFRCVVVNLLQNAVDAISARHNQHAEGETFEGVIVMTASLLEAEPQFFQLEIKDNGIGFEEAVRDGLSTLFSAQYTTKIKGGGAGLHTAGNFALTVKGKIEAECGQNGEGALLRATLPIHLRDV